jgi:hypothetical protein
LAVWHVTGYRIDKSVIFFENFQFFPVFLSHLVEQSNQLFEFSLVWLCFFPMVFRQLGKGLSSLVHILDDLWLLIMPELYFLNQTFDLLKIGVDLPLL